MIRYVVYKGCWEKEGVGGEKPGQETRDETGMVTQAGGEGPGLRAWLWGGRGSPGGRGR